MTTDKEAPKGEKVVGSTVDARTSTRSDLAATQSNRFAENRMIVGEVTAAEVEYWKKLLREATGLHYAGDREINKVEGGLQLLLGARYAAENDPRRKQSYTAKESARRKILQLLTSWNRRDFEADTRVSSEYKEAWQALYQRMVDLGKIYLSVTGSSNEVIGLESSDIDESLAQTLKESYQRLRTGSVSKLSKIESGFEGLIEFWETRKKAQPDSTVEIVVRETAGSRMLRSQILSLAVILISQDYYIRNHFAEQSELPAYQEAVVLGQATTKELAQRLNTVWAQMEDFGYPVHLNDVVPQHLVEEAKDIWKELVTS